MARDSRDRSSAALLSLTALLLAGWPLEASADASNTKQGADPALACADVGAEHVRVNDYRARNSTEFLKWSIDDNYRYHTGPAIDRMRNGEFSHTVMADLAFTLNGWPNHVIALRALIDYALAQGKIYEFQPAECYFARARKIYPDDVAVIKLEGLFFWKLQELDRARDAFLAALAVDDQSLESHYNLGLVYFEMQDYESARAHARRAYAAGYPLPGLMNKLKKKGLWESPGPATAEIRKH